MASKTGDYLDRIAQCRILRSYSVVDNILTIIDEALARKGLSAAAASRLAVGNSSLIKNMRAETGKPKRYNADALQRLAEVLDLEFYFGETRSQTVLQLPAGFAERTVEPLATARARQEALEMGFLPVPYHVAASPSFRGTAPVALARQWLKASDMSADSLAFLPVVSDEMTPILTVGALALIDTSCQSLEDGGILALGLHGRYVFARVQRPSTDILILKGERSDRPVQIFKGDELAALRVLGKVVWVGRQC